MQKQIGSARKFDGGKKTQRILKYGQGISQETKSKHRESISRQSSCELQVVDSEYDVYIATTNIEVEYALPIQQTAGRTRTV